MKNNLFITDLSVSNFRVFKQLNATNFGRINLITGRNNSGKTSLLEALYLNLGPTNPKLWININTRRGLSRLSPDQSTAEYLFNRVDTVQPAEFEVKTSHHGSHKLKISLTKLDSIEVPIPANGKTYQGDSIDIDELRNIGSVSVELELIKEDAKPLISKAVILPQNIQFQQDEKNIYPTSMFLSSGTQINYDEEAKQYDILDRNNQIEDFNRYLRHIEPDLIRTSLGIENDITMVHGDVGFGKVPLSLLGSGGKRLTSIVLALASIGDVLLLIDELENGFHYSILRNIWESIAELADSKGTQIFITTHSYECVKAALDIFEKYPSLDFRLHRLDKKPDKTEMHTFSKDQLKAALEADWEIR